MQSVSPVLTEKEVEFEHVIALDQPEFYPVISLRITCGGQIATYTRYRFTDEERAAIVNGADLLLSQPHHGPLMPIGTQLAAKDSYPTE